MNKTIVRKKNIKDFGNQWKIYGKIGGDYWSSDEIFRDHFGNLFDPKDMENKTVCEVGAGSGRFINILSKYNLNMIYAVEPSTEGAAVIKNNLPDLKNLKIINQTGELFKTDNLCDYVFSIGVIDHIKDPEDVLKNIYQNLKENGTFCLWVYGYENNFLYLLFYKIISIFTKILPDFVVVFLSSILNTIIQPYIFLCKFINLPLKSYLINVFSKYSWTRRNQVIFDQLNPRYAYYYKKEELQDLLNKSGFQNLKFFHRYKYSWSVVCKKKT